jgi:hypothetical protein
LAPAHEEAPVDAAVEDSVVEAPAADATSEQKDAE